MKLSIYVALAVGTIVSATAVLPAFAQSYSRSQVYLASNDNKHSSHYDSRNGSKKSKKHKWRKHHKAVKQYNSSWNNHKSWNWDKHNWNDQRSELRANWHSQRAHLTAAQRARLDADMQVQWRQYKNNNWNGQYTWDQYSDPQFLDYVHTQNPSLLTTVRSYFGY